MMISAVVIPCVATAVFLWLLIRGLYRCDNEAYGAFGAPFVMLWLIPIAITWAIWFAVT